MTAPKLKAENSWSATPRNLHSETTFLPAGSARFAGTRQVSVPLYCSTTGRRVVELTLTEQGRELTTLIPHHLAMVYNNHLAGFTHDEFVTLKQMLRRIIANRDNQG